MNKKLMIAAICWIAVTLINVVNTDIQNHLKNKELARQKEKYYACLQLARENYVSDWNLKCQGEKLQENCTLPSYIATGVNEKWRLEKNECLVRLEKGAF